MGTSIGSSIVLFVPLEVWLALTLLLFGHSRSRREQESGNRNRKERLSIAFSLSFKLLPTAAYRRWQLLELTRQSAHIGKLGTNNSSSINSPWSAA